MLETLDPKALVAPRPPPRPDPAAGVQPPRGDRRALHGPDRPGLRPDRRRRDRRRPRRQRPAQPPARRAAGRVPRPGPESPGFDEVVAALIKKTWDDAPRERPRGGRRAGGAVARRHPPDRPGRRRDGRPARPGRGRARPRDARPGIELRAIGPAGTAPDDWAVAQEIRRFLNRPDADPPARRAPAEPAGRPDRRRR